MSKMSVGLGRVALGSLLIKDLFKDPENAADSIINGLPHFAPKAKRVIYLFQNGAPSQLETFDYKPMLNKMFGQDLPESIRNGQRLTGMTANQDKFPLVGSYSKFLMARAIERMTSCVISAESACLSSHFWQ